MKRTLVFSSIIPNLPQNHSSSIKSHSNSNSNSNSDTKKYQSSSIMIPTIIAEMLERNTYV
jgi:hypothetical protein